MSESYWLEHAYVDGTVREGVHVMVEEGRFVLVEPDAPAPPTGAERLAGLTIPGLANCHSHAFHRALRGHTQVGRGTFWSWREQMYAVAERLDPDSYLALARATYREMALAGITAVGEFHYLHHRPDGTPYDDPNAMGHALVQAAGEAGIRITLLDTCYLAAGFGEPPEGVQRRFTDWDAEAWAARVSGLPSSRLRTSPSTGGDPSTGLRTSGVVTGAAIHSVRAVPREQMPVVVDWAAARGAPLHVHLSEQVAENDACLQAHGCTPAELLADAGVWTEHATAVHATHLTARDIDLLGGQHSFTCLCPTTERDLADGIGPASALRAAGARLTLGSDSHAIIDPFEEMRAVELNERLASQERGHWSPEALLAAATEDGQTSLDWPDAGAIRVGARADLVTLDLGSVRTAGTGATAATAVFAATGADVVQVVADGRLVARREDAAEVGRELSSAIATVRGER